ncbi:MAG: hypothetical protein IPK98_11075 [Chloracidobacterium sp.]|nr:hypothetical protein [Chloracidobacterium sp.]
MGAAQRRPANDRRTRHRHSKSENDLVLATFGRGIYVLDDYAALRQVSKEAMERQSALFPVKDALMYVRSNVSLAGSQGASFYTAPNPAYGATFTYFLKESPKTLRQKRPGMLSVRPRGQNSPSVIRRSLSCVPRLRKKAPSMIFTVTDSEGKIVRRLNASAGAGVQRVVWDMRYLPPSISAAPQGGPPDGGGGGFGGGFGPQGSLVMPGKYTVSMAMRVNGVVTSLPGSQSFNVTVEGKEKYGARRRRVPRRISTQGLNTSTVAHRSQLRCDRGEFPHWTVPTCRPKKAPVDNKS